jgi:putative Mg2+ transporter-C (MgtC) family protein
LSFYTTNESNIKAIIKQLKQANISISSYKLRKQQTAQNTDLYKVELELRIKRHNSNEHLIEMVSHYDDVTISSVE